MATPMCQSSDDAHTPVGPAAATFLGTFYPSGDGVRLCDECMPNFCAAVFEQMTGVDMSPALYLASQQGQENPDGPPGDPTEVAMPPDGVASPTPEADAAARSADADQERGVAEGASSDSPPAPAPADTDQEAGDPTSALSTESLATSTGTTTTDTADTASKSEAPPPEVAEPSGVAE